METITQRLQPFRKFRLSALAKASVIEIFHAIPYLLPSQKHSKKHFSTMSIFPHKTGTIKQEEMIKLRQNGGTKLISIQANPEASKIKWLVELCVLPELKTHMELITRLLGDQRQRSVFHHHSLRPKNIKDRFPIL